MSLDPFRPVPLFPPPPPPSPPPIHCHIRHPSCVAMSPRGCLTGMHCQGLMKNLIGVCDANEKDCQRARQWRLKFAKKCRRGCISVGRRAGFHGGQFLWNDGAVMRFHSPSLLSPSFFLLSSDNDRERYIEPRMRHLIGNSSQESVVKKKSALRRQRVGASSKFLRF